MKNSYDKKIWLSLFWIILGAALLACATAGLIGDFWGGMGGGFVGVGVVQTIRHIRYRTDNEYREKFDVESRDERNRYLATKAMAMAGRLLIIIMGVAVILLQVLGQGELSTMLGGVMCLLLVLYWCSYYYLRAKY